MDLRVMGTFDECRVFADLVMRTVPNEKIRSISDFYPNKGRNGFSNEGRIYIRFGDLSSFSYQAADGDRAVDATSIDSEGRCLL